MVATGPIPSPAVRNTPPDANDYALVVRVAGGGGIGVVVDQGTFPWICSDPILEAAIDVNLSTRASEASLLALIAIVTARLDVDLSTRASEATLANIYARFDVALSTRLSEATFIARINTLGQKLMAVSTPVVIASDQSAIPVTVSGGGGPIDVDVTEWLGSTAPTVGQKTMAASLPVTLASDQTPVPYAPSSTTAGWTTNAQIAVTAAAGIVLPLNANRKWAAIQNVGDQPIRVGPTGLTNVLGELVLPKETLIITQPFVFTGDVWAVRDSTATGDSIVSPQEGV